MENKKRSFNFSLSDARVRRVFIISVAVILVLIAAVGTTLAFIATKTDGVKNVFDPVTITCDVQVTDGNYTIKNTGDYAAYIRAYFVVNWVDGSGNVYGQPPVAVTDYTVTNTAKDVNGNVAANTWEIGSDGFYYYTSPVAPLASTEELVANVTLKTTPPTGYTLQVQMIAEAIQADPIDTIKTYWGVTNSSGKLIYK